MQLTRLWRHRDFVKLWAGQTISLFGSKITFLALPLTAILVLEATSAQMGFLTSEEAIPYLLVGVLGGVWVDRYRRQPIQEFESFRECAMISDTRLSFQS